MPPNTSRIAAICGTVANAPIIATSTASARAPAKSLPMFLPHPWMCVAARADDTDDSAHCQARAPKVWAPAPMLPTALFVAGRNPGRAGSVHRFGQQPGHEIGEPGV